MFSDRRKLHSVPSGNASEWNRVHGMLFGYIQQRWTSDNMHGVFGRDIQQHLRSELLCIVLSWRWMPDLFSDEWELHSVPSGNASKRNWMHSVPFGNIQQHWNSNDLFFMCP